MNEWVIKFCENLCVFLQSSAGTDRVWPEWWVILNLANSWTAGMDWAYSDTALQPVLSQINSSEDCVHARSYVAHQLNVRPGVWMCLLPLRTAKYFYLKDEKQKIRRLSPASLQQSQPETTSTAKSDIGELRSSFRVKRSFSEEPVSCSKVYRAWLHLYNSLSFQTCRWNPHCFRKFNYTQTVLMHQ